MKTALKSFRINKHLISFLEKIAKEKKVSEATIVEMALEKMLEENKQWEADLKAMAADPDYLQEQEDLANEFYEDF